MSASKLRPKQGRVPKQDPPAPTPDPTPIQNSTIEILVSVTAADLLVGRDQQDPDLEGSNQVEMPDWPRANDQENACPRFPTAPPSDDAATPLPTPTRMAASSFKPRVRRKKAAPVPAVPLPDDWASDAASAGQTVAGPSEGRPDAGMLGQALPRDDISMSATAAAQEAAALEDESLGSNSLAATSEIPQPLQAALEEDTALTNQAVDEAAATLTPEAAAVVDTMLSSETGSDLVANPAPDPYSQTLSADTTGPPLEAGDLQPEEVDRDPSISSEADAVIDAGVASVTPSTIARESGFTTEPTLTGMSHAVPQHCPKHPSFIAFLQACLLPLAILMLLVYRGQSPCQNAGALILRLVSCWSPSAAT